MSDLVERLCFGDQTPLQAIQLMLEAATRIMKLEKEKEADRVEILRLKAALHE